MLKVRSTSKVSRKEVRGLYPPNVQNSVQSHQVDQNRKRVVLLYTLKDSSRGLLNAVTSAVEKKHLPHIRGVKRIGKQIAVTTDLPSQMASDEALLDRITRLRSRLEPVINLAARDYSTPDDTLEVTSQDNTTSPRRSSVTRRRHFDRYHAKATPRLATS